MTLDPNLPNNTRENTFWCDIEQVYVPWSLDDMEEHELPPGGGMWTQMCSECADSMGLV